MLSRWWVHEVLQYSGAVALISWIFWVVLSITLHELAHGWAAIWQGDDTPRRLNRMTANPLVHMGQWSLLVFAVLGIAWGLMPVDPSRFRWGRRGRVVVSGAGPAMNVALAFTASTLLIIWLAVGPSDSAIYENLAVFLFTGGWLNLVLALFNMLPIPPLDGASVLSGLSFKAYQFFQRPQSQMIGMFLVLVVLVTGCAGDVFGYSARLAQAYVDGAGAIFGNPTLYEVLYR